jgi:hypothetical protein
MKKILFFLVFVIFSCSVKDDVSQQEKDDDLTGITDSDTSASNDPDNKNEGDHGNTGDTGNSGNTGNTGDSGNTGNSGDSGDTGDSGNSGNSGNSADDEDEIPDEEEPFVEIPCMSDTDCPGSNIGCFLGKCRDKCTAFLNPCDWKPS